MTVGTEYWNPSVGKIFRGGKALRGTFTGEIIYRKDLAKKGRRWACWKRRGNRWYLLSENVRSLLCSRGLNFKLYDGDAVGGSSASQAALFGYVTEDGVTFYATEDGSEIYVQE